jgi:hypothetical protein
VLRKPAEARHLASFGPAGKVAVTVKPKQIVIKSARYQAPDGRGADVTAIVQQMVKEGQTQVPATNGVFGDPVVNVVKQLVVEFTIDGKPFKRTVAENETLELSPVVSAPEASFMLKRGADGVVF